MASLLLTVDATLSLYKTVAFRGGIADLQDFYTTLLVCLILIVVTVLTGLAALSGALCRTFVLPARTILIIVISLGVFFLLGNFAPQSEWIKLAMTSKSESVGICVVLSGLLILLTLNEEVKT